MAPTAEQPGKDSAPLRSRLSSDAPGRAVREGNASGRDQVSDIQRARILAATAEVACERGAANVTVAHIVARSGISRRTFYEQFADREECLLAALEQALQQVAASVVPPYEAQVKWRDRVRAGLAALLAFLDDDPVTGRLLIVEALGVGPRALDRRRHVLAQVITAIDRGREEAKQASSPPPITAEGVAGGVLSLIHTRLAQERAPLLDLLNPLMSMIVLPYLGPAAARREMQQQIPAALDNNTRRTEIGLLRDLDMRLTYRTIRVLLAVGELGEQGPHPSNRQIADASGIRDPGQISKLLRRLERLGLIRNIDPSTKGEPNAWTLTEQGEKVRAALAGQAAQP